MCVWDEFSWRLCKLDSAYFTPESYPLGMLEFWKGMSRMCQGRYGSEDDDLQKNTDYVGKIPKPPSPFGKPCMQNKLCFLWGLLLQCG